MRAPRAIVRTVPPTLCVTGLPLRLLAHWLRSQKLSARAGQKGRASRRQQPRADTQTLQELEEAPRVRVRNRRASPFDEVVGVGARLPERDHHGHLQLACRRSSSLAARQSAQEDVVDRYRAETPPRLLCNVQHALLRGPVEPVPVVGEHPAEEVRVRFLYPELLGLVHLLPRLPLLAHVLEVGLVDAAVVCRLHVHAEPAQGSGPPLKQAADERVPRILWHVKVCFWSRVPRTSGSSGDGDTSLCVKDGPRLCTRVIRGRLAEAAALLNYLGALAFGPGNPMSGKAENHGSWNFPILGVNCVDKQYHSFPQDAETNVRPLHVDATARARKECEPHIAHCREPRSVVLLATRSVEVGTHDVVRGRVVNHSSTVPSGVRVFRIDAAWLLVAVGAFVHRQAAKGAQRAAAGHVVLPDVRHLLFVVVLGFPLQVELPAQVAVEIFDVDLEVCSLLARIFLFLLADDNNLPLAVAVDEKLILGRNDSPVVVVKFCVPLRGLLRNVRFVPLLLAPHHVLVLIPIKRLVAHKRFFVSPLEPCGSAHYIS